MFTAIPAMRLILVVFAVDLVFAEALDCGIHLDQNEELKETMMKCVKNNKTLEELWDATAMSSESDSNSDEVPGVDDKVARNFRRKRSPTFARESQFSNYQQEENSPNDTESNQDKFEDSDESVADNCIVQCILKDLEMTDSNGYPEHDKIVDGLLKTASGREFRDFLRDSTDECFQEMDKEAPMDSCAYSNKLVTCLAEKGRSNCADWPIGNLPFTS